MIEIDHICLAVRNCYEGAHRLREETGLGNYEGGWFPNHGLANRIVPLGDDTYIEVESAVDVFDYERGVPGAVAFHDAAKHGDVFMGWCARTDSREELEALSKRWNAPIVSDSLRVRPDGSARISHRVPDSGSCWRRGIPNVFLYEERDMPHHPARVPASAPSCRAGGITWMEVGGTHADMSAWLGDEAVANLPLTYNGKAFGLYAVAIKTDRGEVVVRRRSLLEPVTV